MFRQTFQDNKDLQSFNKFIRQHQVDSSTVVGFDTCQQLKSADQFDPKQASLIQNRQLQQPRHAGSHYNHVTMEVMTTNSAAIAATSRKYLNEERDICIYDITATESY